MEHLYSVDADELREKIADEGKLVLRPSGLQQFLGCPFQWYQAQLRQDFQRPAAAATAGTSIHKGIEVGYTDKIKTGGELPPLSMLEDVVVEEWQKLNEDNDLEYGKGEDYQLYETQLLKGMKEYYNELMPVTDAVAVERRYTVALDHPVFSAVSGSLDIELDRGVVDAKFTKRKTNANKYVLQQSTYSWLKEANGGVSNFNEIHNIIRGKGVERLSLAPKKDYARYVINQILDTTEQFLETGEPNLFRGTNSHAYFLCSEQWCGYYSKCPHVQGL